MKAFALFGLVALLPMALAVTPARAGTMTLMICSGSGPARAIEVPLPGKERPGENPCCMKGCHSAGGRKKAQRQFDAPQ